jgi:2-succinyl-6-hydroxy-2,4-cyclohexadiene-1-carboxylate synthase
MPLPYYEVHGDEGPCLLLVHGMLSGRSQWLENIDALKQICRPVILELWGHGRSASPKSSDLYRHSAYIDFFEQIREKIGIDTWFVCGQSFGATLTFRYAAACPERIKGHIFTNSVSAFGGVDSSAENQQRIREQATLITSQGRSILEQMPIHPKNARRLPEATRDALLRDADILDPGGVANTLQHVADSSVTNILSQVTMPNLLVCGTREKPFARGLEIAKEHIANLEIVTADVGHAVNIQASDIFNKAVTGFIQGLEN